jgi:hypothetical protein
MTRVLAVVVAICATMRFIALVGSQGRTSRASWSAHFFELVLDLILVVAGLYMAGTDGQRALSRRRAALIRAQGADASLTQSELKANAAAGTLQPPTCYHCGYNELAVDAPSCPRCGVRDPNPRAGLRRSGRSVLVTMACAAFAGAVWGYFDVGAVWSSIDPQIVLNLPQSTVRALAGGAAGAAVGLIVGLFGVAIRRCFY